MPFKAFVVSPDIMQPGHANTREWRAAEIPSTNGHGNARALARVYGTLARGGELDGVRVLSPEAIDQAIAEQSSGTDAVLGCLLASGWVSGSPGPRSRWGPTRGRLGIAEWADHWASPTRTRKSASAT